MEGGGVVGGEEGGEEEGTAEVEVMEVMVAEVEGDMVAVAVAVAAEAEAVVVAGGLIRREEAPQSLEAAGSVPGPRIRARLS